MLFLHTFSRILCGFYMNCVEYGHNGCGVGVYIVDVLWIWLNFGRCCLDLEKLRMYHQKWANVCGFCYGFGEFVHQILVRGVRSERKSASTCSVDALFSPKQYIGNAKSASTSSVDALFGSPK